MNSFFKNIVHQKYRQWCHDMDEGRIPEGIERLVEELKRERELQTQMNQLNASAGTPKPPSGSNIYSDDADMIESPS